MTLRQGTKFYEYIIMTLIDDCITFRIKKKNGNKIYLTN